MPEGARGIVAFAHGSGSGRHSPRNQMVAAALVQAGFGTLLLDLLDEEEERADARTGHPRFDVELLARRVAGAIGWLAATPATSALPVGLFGASTGSAAALLAAAKPTEWAADVAPRPEDPDRAEPIAAVVSRGGRPDLAGEALVAVRSPTLLIVGERDEQVLALNQGRRSANEGADRARDHPGRDAPLRGARRARAIAELAGRWFAQWMGSE